MEFVLLVEERGHKGDTIATAHGLNFRYFCAGIRAHFGAQIPGTKSSPASGPLVSFNTYGPESGLDFVPGIWAPKCARIPAQKVRTIRACGVAMVQLCCRPSPTRTTDSLPQPGRDSGLSMSRRVQSADSTASCGSDRAARVLSIQVLQAMISYTEHTATPGNGTLSPKNMPRFRVII